jgi:CheY-like chemotaxis protein
LGSRIKLQSTHGAGSLFAVVLPVSDKQVVAEVAKINQNAAVSSEGLSAISVLCLDNDVPVLEAMEMVISGWGCEFVGLVDYQAALSAVQENPFDIVLVDYSLDGTETGIHFMRELKKIDESIPAVLITAEQDQQKREQALEMGYHFMAKPIAPLELKQLLSQIFNKG